MKRFVIFLILCLAATPLFAQERYYAPPGDSLRGHLVEMSVVDRQTGSSLPIYNAQGLRFIEGVPGRPYSIRLVNRSNERLLVVLAVDGINAISGRTASYNQTGYVLAPYGTLEVTGWRRSFQSVAQFVFTRPEASYAGRTDRLWQVGVIGAAIFREDVPRPVYHPAEPMMSESAGAPAPAASRSAQADTSRGVGTGYGRGEWSQATSTTFDRRSSAPDEVLRLDYDDRQGLYQRGVRDLYPLPGYDRPGRYPEAFPEGFAPPPRW